MKAKDILDSDWFDNAMGWMLIVILVSVTLFTVVMVVAGFTGNLSPTDCVIIDELEYCR